MFSLQGKRALITGAAGGIGRKIAETLHAQGATVFLTDMSQEKLDALSAQLKDRVFVKVACLTEPQEIDSLVKEATEKMGGVDILVNNAGITKDGLLIRMSDEQFQQVMQVNLMAGVRLIRALLPAMMKQRFGRIINMASIVGALGNAGQANYSASKAALIAVSKTVAQEVASRGITSNCIAPGFVQTPMTDCLPAEVKEKMLVSIPVKRFGQTEDIAAAVAFLASEEASYITGQTLHINGGMCML